MNFALQTTTGDFTRSLQKLMSGDVVETEFRATIQRYADQLVKANISDHPGLTAKLSKTGPMTYSIALSAPGLWTSIYGSMSTEEKGFEIHPTQLDPRHLAEPRGES